MAYNEHIHAHRLAVWVAARATHRGIKGLSRKICEDALAYAGFSENDHSVFSEAELPEAAEFDIWHAKRCQKIIRFLRCRGIARTFGIAAKILNCYLKVRFFNPDKRSTY